MHVGHLNLNESWGGGEYQLLCLARGIVASGAGCTLFVLEGSPLAERAAEAGLCVVGLPRRVGFRRLAAALGAAGCSVLHAHDSRGLSLGGRVAHRLGLPLIYSRRIASALRRNPFSRRKYSPARIDGVVAISETVRRVFLAGARFPPERVHVVPSGVAVADAARVARDAELRAFAGSGLLAGGLGKLSAKKNWRFLVDVAAAVRDAGDDLRWVIAGEGEERGRLEARIAQLGLQDRVRLLGFRPDGLAVLKSLDLLFFPSLMEGAGVTVLEAMALGVPVVAVASEGVSETLGGCGCLVAADDVAAAAQHVLALAREPARRAALAADAAARVRQRYSIQAMIDGNLAVYATVARPAGARCAAAP